MPAMIKASRIWIACEERNGYLRSQVPQHLCTGAPRPLELPSKSLNTFLFPLTNRSKVSRRPICLSPHHTHLGPSGSNALLSSITTCYIPW